MITREEYMRNSGLLHHDYYAQFVTDATLDFVRTRIGMSKLRKSTDQWFNDVAKHGPGPNGRWVWDYSPVNIEMMYQAGEVTRGYAPSPSTHTCVGKAAARILLAEDAQA